MLFIHPNSSTFKNIEMSMAITKETEKIKKAPAKVKREKKTSIERIVPAKEPVYLEGPKSRTYELRFALTVFKEFIKAFRTLHFVGPCITVFGSARFKEDNQYYKKAMEVGKAIADIGFTTMTGGGPGIMEAANRGAFEHEGVSIGCNIILPHEQQENKYLTKSLTFEHFFVRKTILIKYSYAFIIMPGGFGTMDEFYEILTLIQTKSVTQFPVVLFGTAYYASLMANIQFMAEEGTISKEDLELVLLTDSVTDAMDHIAKYIQSNYKVVPRKKFSWLFERT